MNLKKKPGKSCFEHFPGWGDQNPIISVERLNLLCNDASHFEDLVGVAPFVVIPGADFDEGLVELDTGFDVEDGGPLMPATLLYSRTAAAANAEITYTYRNREFIMRILRCICRAVRP